MQEIPHGLDRPHACGPGIESPRPHGGRFQGRTRLRMSIAEALAGQIAAVIDAAILLGDRERRAVHG